MKKQNKLTADNWREEFDEKLDYWFNLQQMRLEFHIWFNKTKSSFKKWRGK